MVLDIFFVLGGLVGLYIGGEFLVEGASRLALKLNIPALVIGLTVVAIGTSAPELVVSTLAALQGNPGLAMGNVIGSNIANIGLILGVTGLVSVIVIKKTLVRREIPIMLIITIFASLLILDGQLSRLDGVLLLFGFIVYNGFFYWLSQQNDHAELEIVEIPEDAIKVKLDKINVLLEVGRVLAGSLVLVIGAQLMVEGATSLARAIGVSDLVIGVTMVAFGTSLPELATSLTAAFKGESDIAVGNVIGSNVANLLLVLGATSAIATINVGQTDLDVVEFVVMLGLSFVLWGFSRDNALSRWQAVVFLGVYIAFILYTFLGAPSGIPAV